MSAHQPQSIDYSSLVGGDERQQYRRLHIQSATLIYSLISALVSLIGIALGIVAILHGPQLIHQYSIIYIPLLHRWSHPRHYRTLYLFAMSSWIGLHSVHLITIAMSIVGIRLCRPRLLRPQLLLLCIQFGLYMCAIVSCTTLGILIIRMPIYELIIFIPFLLFTVTDLYLLVRCHRHLHDKYRALMQILANTKSVHFKTSKS